MLPHENAPIKQRKEKEKEKEGNLSVSSVVKSRNARLRSSDTERIFLLANKQEGKRDDPTTERRKSERTSECTIPIIFECIIVRPILPRSPDQATLDPTYC